MCLEKILRILKFHEMISNVQQVDNVVKRILCILGYSVKWGL